MGSTLKDAPSEVKIAVADIVYHGEQMILPDGMTIQQAQNLLKQREAYENEVVELSETFDAFPLDGAVQLDSVLNRIYGFAPAIKIDMFFFDIKPQLLMVEIGPNQNKMVPWGRFKLPNIEGHIDTSSRQKDGRYCFHLEAQCKRENEKTVRALFDELRKEIRSSSIYRGKAIRMRFRNNKGQPLKIPEPKFIDTDQIDETKLVYSNHIMAAVVTNLFTPITRAKDCVANNIPIKRGILLGGPFGTGKTLAAAVASKLAVKAGVTYIYVLRADELVDALRFAQQYQSPASVVFCEDIDRVTEGERDKFMDELLNTIDGIDSKNNNIITVLTTNHIELINKAMLRPGRLDAVIKIDAPDAEAVQLLLRVYGDNHIDINANLFDVGHTLAGQIPAVIAEVVKRAKLSQLASQPPGTIVNTLSVKAIQEAADTMMQQIQLLEGTKTPPKSITIDDIIRSEFRRALGYQLATPSTAGTTIDAEPESILHKVGQIRDRIIAS